MSPILPVEIKGLDCAPGLQAWNGAELNMMDAEKVYTNFARFGIQIEFRARVLQHNPVHVYFVAVFNEAYS